MKAYRVKSSLFPAYCEVQEIEVEKFGKTRVYFGGGRSASIRKGCSDANVAYHKERDSAYDEAIAITERSIALAKANLRRAEETLRLLRETKADGTDYYLKVAYPSLE